MHSFAVSRCTLSKLGHGTSELFCLFVTFKIIKNMTCEGGISYTDLINIYFHLSMKLKTPSIYILSYNFISCIIF